MATDVENGGLQDFLFEIASEEPVFDISQPYLTLYRGTSEAHFEDARDEVYYGKNRILHFTTSQDDAQSHALNKEGKPVIISLEVPWEAIKGELSNSGNLTTSEMEEPGIYFREQVKGEKSDWVGYGIPSNYVKSVDYIQENI